MDDQPPSPPPAQPNREEMDRIRQRRLEKLSGSGQSPSSSPVPTSDAQAPKPAQPPPTSAQFQPKVTARPAPNTPGDLAMEPAGSIPQLKRAAGTEPKAREVLRRIDMDNPESTSFKVWADSILSDIFRITLNPDRTKTPMGYQLTLLPDSSRERTESGDTLLIGLDSLDGCLLEYGSSYPKNKPLIDQFLACHARVLAAAAAVRRPSTPQTELLKEARRLCVSHAIWSVTMSAFYERDEPDSLTPSLLKDYGAESSISIDFIADCVARFPEDEEVAPAFVKAMVQISQELATKNMDSNYRNYFQALELYSKFPALLDALSADRNFNPSREPQEIETKSLLGPFFRVSPLQLDDAINYFPNPRADESQQRSGFDSVRANLKEQWHKLYQITDRFVRAGETSRNRILSWFAYILNRNHKRSASYPPRKEIATDGFMLNITAVLDRLAEPFMDTTFSKVDRIDVDYFRRNARVDIEDETKLNADQETSKAFYQTSAAGKNNFITEVFFLTLASHYYGLESLHTTLKNADQEVGHFEREISNLERMRSSMPPHTLPRLDQTLHKYTDILKKYAAGRLAIMAALTDQNLQTLSLRFMRYVAVWLLRLSSGSPYVPGKDLGLPLPQQAPAAFVNLPEYTMLVVTNSLRFIFTQMPEMVRSTFGDEMFIFCITFLQAKSYIKNPYIKTGLVSLLHMGATPRYTNQVTGYWGDQLMTHKFAQAFLLRSLMEFYIESESTIQFYDKFSTRYDIFEVIRAVWPNDEYKRRLSRESKHNRDFFVHFVNLVLNDATYVLDEALTKFPKIHNLQLELRNAAALPQEQREAKEKELKQLENSAKSYMQLSNKIIEMMVLFTSAMKEAFLMPEIVFRLAAMLDYNLLSLTGPKSRDLKTENMAQYLFDPKLLLGQFVDIYLRLGTSDEFIDAVAQDGRSYSAEMIDGATRILHKTAVKSPDEMVGWIALTRKFKDAKERMDLEELDLGEIPAEFEDPLLSTLMKDPVMLPSKNVVDRQTIVQHLLSDAMDPFTRQPMTINDVVPADELREKIEKWRTERIAEARANMTAKKEAKDKMEVDG